MLALTHLINSYVQLACLFLPRLYALYKQTKQSPSAGDSGSKLGSYGLIPLKAGGSRAGVGGGGVGCVENSNGCAVDGDGCVGKSDGFASGSNGRVSVSDAMGSNTISIGESSVVVWECKDEEMVTDTAAV